MSLREELNSPKRVVIKIGSSSLTGADAAGLKSEAVDSLVDVVAALRKSGAEVVIVSSGAIAAGLSPLGLTTRPKDLATQQGCCDGAAAQDAHVRQERKERRAEIKNLRASNKQMRELLSAIQIDTNADGSVWLTLSPSAYPGFIAVVYLGSQKLMAGTAALLFDELRRKALEGKP